jgi:anti-anti-sigma factor
VWSFSRGVARIIGELDMNNTDALHETLLHCEGLLILDVSEATFMDSFGSRSLIRAKQGCPDMQIVKSSRVVDRLFEMSGLTAFFNS